MELFIRIKDGKPFEHPILGDNFRDAFPDIDPDHLPSDFARFERIPQPSIGPYEINEGVIYQWDNDRVKDVWQIRQMTEQEKIDKQNSVKAQWSQFGFASWVFNEEKCEFEAPVPMPLDAEFASYRWNESSVSWVEV